MEMIVGFYRSIFLIIILNSGVNWTISEFGSKSMASLSQMVVYEKAVRERWSSTERGHRRFSKAVLTSTVVKL